MAGGRRKRLGAETAVRRLYPTEFLYRFLAPGVRFDFWVRGRPHPQPFARLCAAIPTSVNVWSRVFVSNLKIERATRKVTALGIGIYLEFCQLPPKSATNRSTGIAPRNCASMSKIPKKPHRRSSGRPPAIPLPAGTAFRGAETSFMPYRPVKAEDAAPWPGRRV